MGIQNQAIAQSALSLSGSTSLSIEALAQFNHLMPPEIWRWRDGLIDKHSFIASHLIRCYIHTARKSGYAAANHQLRRSDQRLQVPCLSRLRTRVVTTWADISDDEICDHARANAETCTEVYASAVCNGFDEGIKAVVDLVEQLGFSLPATLNKADSEKQRQQLAGAIARVSDERWWRMQLRRQYSRIVEQLLRDLGAVKGSGEAYVSNWAFKRWQQSTKRNRAVLDGLEAINEQEEVCSLIDAVDASVSNPANRRRELMTRMRGYEEIAESMHFKGLFLTLTAPSKYHSYLWNKKTKAAYRNPKSIDASPLETMTYLNGVWSRIRAQWKRKGIKTFGFRVAEPHKDGTPHWHMMLFFSEEHTELAWSIFKTHALKEDGHEAGAFEKRADRVNVDEQQGSATGYIAKYITKNIDGEGIELDFETGDCAKNSALKTRAWASVWGIRQFQQIGSVSVTVWRELRKRTKPLDEWEPQAAEALRAAASDNGGDWAKFVELMGGATVARDDQTLKPIYDDNGIHTGRYGEAAQHILGLVMHGVGRFIKTRLHIWRIREKPLIERSEALVVAAQPPPLDLCQ